MSGNDRYSDSRYNREPRERADRNRDYDRHDRRRSRSPRRRGRDDSNYYSTSRSYREREREDKRGDGGWARDRNDGRRRDDDRRRDDRDGDRRGRRDREFEPRERRNEPQRGRSATPPVKKREPTPDLTPFVMVLQRKRRMTQWDIKPPGYENITAEQAKLSGMFPLPGAPRQQPMDPQRLQALVNQPQSVAATSALKPTMARQAKRLFVYNIPPKVSNEDLVNFFNLQLNGMNVVKSVDPCQSAHISPEKPLALLEFKNPNDATVALALNGLSMTEEDNSMEDGDGINGKAGLSIKRPDDYIGPSALPAGDEPPSEVSRDVPDSTEKILITNLAPFLEEEQVKQLLVAIGALKSFVLASDDSNQSRGFAFCEYVDPTCTDIAFEGLNGMDIGGKIIKLQRACVGQEQIAAEMGVNAMSMLAGQIGGTPTRVLQLLNMTTAEDLIKEGEYEDLMEDIEDEGSKFGTVLKVKIPRPAGARTTSGVGKIFVKFETVEQASKAMAAMAGRKYSDRTVVVGYFNEEYFDVDAW